MTNNQPRRRRPIPSAIGSIRKARRGSTLVVVLALLALLSVLGLTFVTFAGSERTSAENFSAAAEQEFRSRPRPSSRVLVRFASGRILSAARSNESNSAFSGGRHSLLGSLFGNDTTPHSGIGVNVIGHSVSSRQTGFPAVDQNYDGAGDALQTLMEINDSRSANNGSMPSRPAPDVDYTAPDLNSVFLAYNGYALGPDNRPVHVIIPSFARPQYIRGYVSGAMRATPVLDWETRTATSRKVLRPHPQHKDYGPAGALRTSGLDPQGWRYVRTKAEAIRLGLSGPFPFGQSEDSNQNGQLDLGEDLNDNGVLDAEAHHGVWTLGRWMQDSYYRVGQWVLVSEDANGNNIYDNGEDTLAANNRLDRWYFRVEQAGLTGSAPPNFSAVGIGSYTPLGQPPVFRRFARFQPRYEFDADPDGDGIKEAIWLDLDFPVQTLGDGKRTIPMFAFTIYDADGLLNLNATGNTSGTVNLGGTAFGSGGLISRSNLGVTPYEVNPLWGLDADALPTDFPYDSRRRGEVFQDHRSFFLHTPNNWVENANMEWWFLLKGRAIRTAGSNAVDVIAQGRHGEYNRLVAALTAGSTSQQSFPQPGLAGIDDNYDQDLGEQSPPFSTARLARQRAYVHPMDFRGTGTSTIKVGGVFRPQFLTHNRHKFLQYTRYQAQQVSMVGPTIKWGQALSNALMQNSLTTPLRDEQAESVLDNRNRQSSDALFPSNENFFLQASRTDLETAGFESRLARLAEYNFKINSRSDEIRHRFTVDSGDTRNFAKPFHGTSATASSQRIWEFWQAPVNAERDANMDNVLDPIEDQGFDYNGERDSHLNRYSVRRFAFPPRFQNAPIWAATDPFRPQLRRRLWMVANEAPVTRVDTTVLQRRISPNHVLHWSDTDGDNAPDAGEILNRPLTEHPQNPGVQLVPITWTRNNHPTYPGSNQTEREWWARFDRQCLARDVYVMLYTLCGGSDQVNYTTTNDHNNTQTPAGNNSDRHYTTQQLREMAQFAVNLVDAMDTDNVVTRFEYDKNLGITIDPQTMMQVCSGWNLDDNAWTPDGPTSLVPGANGYDIDHPTDSVERGVVYGVEAQQLTLSEFFAARANQVTNPDNNDAAEDHGATAHDDSLPQVFAGIELRNTTPFDIPLSGGSWRIEVRPNPVVPPPVNLNDPTYVAYLNNVRRVTFRSNRTIEAATSFSILSCIDDQLKTAGSYSTLEVDPDFTPGALATRLRVFPKTLAAADVLDLCRDTAPIATATPFRISDGNGIDKTPTVGSFLTGSPFASGNLSVQVILQRRMHPDRTSLDPLTSSQSVIADYDLDNPWIEVDRMIYIRAKDTWEFAIKPKDNDATASVTHNIRKQLWELRSRQRPQPFDRSLEADFKTGPADNWPDSSAANAAQWRPPVSRNNFALNSIGTLNTNSPATFDRWQPHFDRPFASLIDLFDVPVYGPHNVTASLDLPGSNSAGHFKFLRPDFPNTINADIRRDNRWARLLSFLEIPTRTDRFLANTLPDNRKYRDAGKINLNTIRHPEALAGLIDRPDTVSVAPTLENSHLPDANGETARDWWSELIKSRDGYDPVSELYLPGMAHGRPFRSLGLTHFGNNGLEQTLLRSIPLDNSTTVGDIKRRLFELGNQAQHNNNSVHSHTRHRLLAKIFGNSTTRSNVFFVFMQVDWFECHQDSAAGHVRIGNRLTGAESQRAFFVIDRTRALELLQGNHIPNDNSFRIGQGPGTGGTGTGNSVSRLDPGPMILYQRIIE